MGDKFIEGCGSGVADEGAESLGVSPLGSIFNFFLGGGGSGDIPGTPAVI